MVLLVEFSGRIVFFELESLGVFASLRDIIFRGREHGVSQSYPSMIMVPPSSPCFPIYTHISQLTNFREIPAPLVQSVAVLQLVVTHSLSGRRGAGQGAL